MKVAPVPDLLQGPEVHQSLFFCLEDFAVFVVGFKLVMPAPSLSLFNEFSASLLAHPTHPLARFLGILFPTNRVLSFRPRLSFPDHVAVDLKREPGVPAFRLDAETLLNHAL